MTQAAHHRVPRPLYGVEASLARWMAESERSLLREMVGRVAQPGVLSLAGGLPAQELFPKEELLHQMERVLSEDDRALQYGMPLPSLKAHVCDLMAQRGVAVGPEQVLLVTGAQQGLDVASRVLLDPGDLVALETYAYTGIRQAIAPFSPEILELRSDLDTGLDTESFARQLESGARPKLVYVIPDAHNPLGVSLPQERRDHLVELAREFGFVIVEDDPYGHVYFDEPFAPPLRALDEHHVIYVGSFSKIVAPGLRMGWMIVPETLLERIAVAKEAGDLESSGFVQRVLSGYLDSGQLPQRLDVIRATYQQRCSALLEALAEHLDDVAEWGSPRGGMFVWLRLRKAIDTLPLLGKALEQENVAFIPGAAFARSRDTVSSSMRLSFSSLDPENLNLAVAKLAAVLRRARS